MPVQDNRDWSPLVEADHRIANSLLTIRGYVHLQGSKFPTSTVSVSAAAVRETFREVEAQIDAVGRLHRLLALAGWRDVVDMSQHLYEVDSALMASLAAGREIDLVEIFETGCLLSSGQALALTPVVAELVTNALKHAYPSGAGRIVVRCRKDGDGWLLIEVADDGPGFPAGVDQETGGGVGLRLMRAACKRLGAALTLDTGVRGVKASIRLPILRRDQSGPAEERGDHAAGVAPQDGT